jgi:hypothetical protein
MVAVEQLLDSDDDLLAIREKTRCRGQMCCKCRAPSDFG